MANWKVYTIISIFSYGDYLRINLNDYVNYSNRDIKDIACVRKYPFTSYRAGDKIEIDNDRTRYYTNEVRIYLDEIEANKMIREFVLSSPTNTISTSGSSSDISISPSAVNAMKSPGAMEIAREMSRMVDETGKNWEYKIEVASQDGKTISHSLICRKD